MELRDGLVMNYSSLFIDVVWVRIYIFSRFEVVGSHRVLSSSIVLLFL